MNKIMISLFICCTFTLYFSCKTDSKKNKIITKAEPSFKKEGELTLPKANGDTIKVLNIEVADDEYQRQTGLMYRKSMKPEEGMLFIFPREEPRSFYMKNTHIPLDIIYINNSKKIVSIQKNAQPLNEQSLPSESPAKYVLEINAGLSQRWNIVKGDILQWTIEN